MRSHSSVMILLAAAALTAAGCGSESAKEPPPPLVRTMTAGNAAASEAGYTGTVRGRYETQLAFQVGGQILARNVSAGARVRAGDVLMVIDARDVQQQANAAGAGTAAARALGSGAHGARTIRGALRRTGGLCGDARPVPHE